LICIIGLVGCDSRAPAEGRVDSVFGGPGLSPGEFSYPRALAVSPVDGCIYIVDKTARIQRFSPGGEYQHQWRMPEWTNGKPTGLFVDRRDHLWVADTHYARVIAFDRDGKELLRFGGHGEGPGEFTFPCSVAVGPDDLVYVGEYGGSDRINKFTQQGVFVSAFADKASGPAWVERPVGLAFDESGDLWVADACHHRICRFSRDGKLLSTFGQPGSDPGQLNYPYGLALEPRGTLLVADRGNNRIVRFDRTGKYLGHWGGPGRAVGQLAQPWGVAVSARGRIYALDSWNNRVQVVHW
jgi:DNA-binding beta-propeller fold protein YncE